MSATTLLERPALRVDDYRCSTPRGAAPFVERHAGYSLSCVRRGSFGSRVGARSFELGGGSLLIGRPGDEYVCTHDHAEGDECLAFHLSEELVETIGDADAAWRTAGVPAVAELGV